MPISTIGANGLNKTEDFTIDGLTVGKGGGNVATNTVVGYQAANSNTTGRWNTAIGYQAAYSNTTGEQQVAVGRAALFANTTGTEHTAVGHGALASNTTGNYSSAFGNSALSANTTGSNNVAVGYSALVSNTTASNNTAVGYQAGYSNTTSAENTMVGATAGYNATGQQLTIIGKGAGYNLTTGANNTFIGVSAGYFATTGTRNTFIGVDAGISGGAGGAITTGSKNTIIGGYSGNNGGLDIRTANNYIVLSDGDGNPRAYWNNNGTATLAANASGDQVMYVTNTASSNPYGIQCTFLNATPNNTTNTFFIGADSTNSKILIYSSGTISNRTGTYNTISDAKLKENIVDATPKLDKLMDVKVRNYNLIGDELKQIGFVAQELEQVFPSLIDNVPDLDEDKNPTGEVTKGVKLTVMIPILVKAIQELKAEFDAYKASHP